MCGLPLNRLDAVSVDHAVVSLLLKLGGYVENEPLYQIPLYRIGAGGIEIADVLGLDPLQGLEEVLEHRVMHLCQLRLDNDGTLADLSALVGLGELSEEHIGQDFSVLDIASAGEDVVEGGNHQDPGDEGILPAHQELLAETGILQR